MPRTAIGTLLPLAIFPLLPYFAIKIVLRNRETFIETIKTQCTSSTIYNLQYTTIPGLDSTLCKLVVFFHAGMLPETKPFLIYGLWSLMPVFSVFVIESYRKGRSHVLAYNVLFGCLAQLATLAVTTPIFFLVLILTNPSAKRKEARHITQAEAEAAVFGLVLSYVGLTIGMTVLDSPIITAIWQAFPVWSSIAQALHLTFRPSSRHLQSGRTTIRTFYSACFLLTAAVHIWAVIVSVKDDKRLYDFFLPSTAVITEFNDAVRDVFQWDVVFTSGAALLGSLWFADTAKELFRILLWYTLAIPLLGPGAAISGTLLWREIELDPVSDGKKVE